MARAGACLSAAGSGEDEGQPSRHLRRSPCSPQHAGLAGCCASRSDTRAPRSCRSPAPERLPALPIMDAQQDPSRLAEGLRDSIQYEPRLADVAALPELPAPERQRAETRACRRYRRSRPLDAARRLPPGRQPSLCPHLSSPPSLRGPHLSAGDLSAAAPQCDCRE